MKILALIILLTIGCSLNQGLTIERENLYYRIVKTLVNEPEIRSKLTQNQIYRLVEIEKMYQDGVDVLDCVARVCYILLDVDTERKNEIKYILMIASVRK